MRNGGEPGSAMPNSAFRSDRLDPARLSRTSSEARPRGAVMEPSMPIRVSPKLTSPCSGNGVLPSRSDSSPPTLPLPPTCASLYVPEDSQSMPYPAGSSVSRLWKRVSMSSRRPSSNTCTSTRRSATLSRSSCQPRSSSPCCLRRRSYTQLLVPCALRSKLIRLSPTSSRGISMRRFRSASGLISSARYAIWAICSPRAPE